MNLHDPQTELEILRLAKSGRKGQAMEARDRWPWQKWIMAPVWVIAILGYLAHMMGAFDPDRRVVHWQYLICSLVVLWTAKFGAGLATAPIARNYATLVNLPVKGETLFELSRRSFFIRFAPFLILVCGPFSYAVGGFTWEEPVLLAISTVLMAGTTLATAIIIYDASLAPSLIRRIYDRFFQIQSLGLVISYWFLEDYSKTGGTPKWLAEGIYQVTWLLPPSWCLPGRIGHGGGVVALSWCVFGFTRWMLWPRRLGHLFDAPKDVFINEEATEEEEAKSADTDEAIPITTLPAPLAVPGEGWVERWVRRVIGGKDAIIAGTLVEQNSDWTKNTNLAIYLCPILLAVNWVVLKMPIKADWFETAAYCIWIISIVAIPLLLQQFPNAVPRMTGQWSTGPQALPFLALLPISVRDVLRVSMRITFARTVILAAISGPYLWCLFSIHEIEMRPMDLLWLVLSGSWILVTSRPLFILNRIQSLGRCRRGIYPIHCALNLLLCLIALIWLIASATGVAFGLFWMGTMEGDNDFGFIAAVSLGGLAVSALSSRATFEIHHWRMRRGHFDWVSGK